jgi:hypothetical protein
MSILIDEVKRQTEVRRKGKSATSFTLFTAKIMFEDIPATAEDVELLFSKYSFKWCFLVCENGFVRCGDNQALWDNFDSAIGVAVNIFIDDSYIE